MHFVADSGADVRLVEGMAEQFVLCVTAREIPRGTAISQLPSQPVRTFIGPASRVRFAWLVCVRLWQQRESTDCVIVQGYGLTALAANLCGRLTRTSTIMLVCSPVEAYYRCRVLAGASQKPYRASELLGLRMLARVNAVLGQRYMVLSKHLETVVRGHGTSRPVHVLPLYGVDTTTLFPPDEPKAFLKARAGLPSTGTLIIESSRVAPEKDHLTFLEAVRHLLRQGRDIWVLHLSGGHSSFMATAKDLGIAERIIAGDAVDPRTTLPDFYRSADLCVQPSREEGLGFTPLEALACRVPVVAARVGGLKETIIDGETGWTYTPGNYQELARCIEAALDDPQEAARRVERGRSLVCERYERYAVFDRLSEVIHTTVKNRPATPQISHQRGTCAPEHAPRSRVGRRVQATMNPSARVALIDDFAEEFWPSMDLVADMLDTTLRQRHSEFCRAIRVCPPMRRRFSRLAKESRLLHNADRFLARFCDYPTLVRMIRERFDIFHILDHSYAHLAHELPPDRTIVTCHDLDAFRCLLDAGGTPRSYALRAMARRTLRGLSRVYRVTCDSVATQDELLAWRLVPADRVLVIPNGVHPAYRPHPDPSADPEAEAYLGPPVDDAPELIHVGSTAPRKRIDLLLKGFASIKKCVPRARLIRVGGVLTPEQQRVAAQLGVKEAIVNVPFLPQRVVASLYRRASVALLPSEAEGFGLPVIESLACGTPVVASDIPVLREVGGDAVQYAAVGDIDGWRNAVLGLFGEQRQHPDRWRARREAGFAHAGRFSWTTYAAGMVEVYRDIARRNGHASSTHS